MKYQVWYMRPEFFRNGIMGVKWLKEHGALPYKSNLGTTHVHLMERSARGLEDLWIAMQGENWSPNGEARSLIKDKGLQHTSMSVGDIAVDEKGTAWIVDQFGWVDLPMGKA